MRNTILATLTFIQSFASFAAPPNQNQQIPHMRSGLFSLAQTSKEYAEAFSAMSEERKQHYLQRVFAAALPKEVVEHCPQASLVHANFAFQDDELSWAEKYIDLASDWVMYFDADKKNNAPFCSVAALSNALLHLKKAEYELPDEFKTEIFFRLAQAARLTAQKLTLLPVDTKVQQDSYLKNAQEWLSDAERMRRFLPSVDQVLEMIGGLQQQLDEVIESMDEDELETMAENKNAGLILASAAKVDALKESLLTQMLESARAKLQTNNSALSVQESALQHYADLKRVELDKLYIVNSLAEKKAVVRAQNPLHNLLQALRLKKNMPLSAQYSHSQLRGMIKILTKWLGPHSVEAKWVQLRLPSAHAKYLGIIAAEARLLANATYVKNE